jgi:hypothetical protein
MFISTKEESENKKEEILAVENLEDPTNKNSKTVYINDSSNLTKSYVRILQKT